MTLERSLLDRDLSNVEEALDEAEVLLRWGLHDPDMKELSAEILECLKRAQRELKAFRERWKREAA